MERKKRSEIQLCYPLEERRLTEPKFGWSQNFPVICQPKLDGVRCRAVSDGHSVILLSSTCSTISSVPHINKELEAIKYRFELDGELYIHGENFETINSIVSRTVNLHEDSSKIEFHAFDIIQPDIQLVRLDSLTVVVTESPNIKIVECLFAYSFQDIIKIYEKFLSDGYEGIIVRHKLAPYVRKRSTFVLKFKPKKSDVYEIVDYSQMIDKNGYRKAYLGSLTCTSDEGTKFSVGSGMDAKFREEVWKNPNDLIGKFCKISYQHMTSKGSPRFPIFISVLDDNPEESPDIETGIL